MKKLMEGLPKEMVKVPNPYMNKMNKFAYKHNLDVVYTHLSRGLENKRKDTWYQSMKFIKTWKKVNGLEDLQINVFHIDKIFEIDSQKNINSKRYNELKEKVNSYDKDTII